MRKLSQINWYFYLAVLILLIILGIPYFLKPGHFGILDYADLPLHESGHYIFFFLAPEFLRVLGGTLAQLAFPLAFAFYFFFFRKDYYAGLAVSFWFFQNFLNISVYMRDARFMLLPLLGDPEAHDWNYLFGKMKLLHSSVAIADFFRAAGIIGILAVIGIMAFLLVTNKPVREDIDKEGKGNG